MGIGFKNEPGKICGRQPLKDFTWCILQYLDPNVGGETEFRWKDSIPKMLIVISYAKLRNYIFFLFWKFQ